MNKEDIKIGAKIQLKRWDSDVYVKLEWFEIHGDLLYYAGKNKYGVVFTSREELSNFQLYEDPKKYCNWKYYNYGSWYEYKTDCENEHPLLDGFKYCPYCGLEIREEKQIKGFTFDGEVNCPSVFEGEVTVDTTIKKDIKDTNLFSGSVNGIKYLGEELLDKLESLTERVNKLETTLLVNESRSHGC